MERCRRLGGGGAWLWVGFDRDVARRSIGVSESSGSGVSGCAVDQIPRFAVMLSFTCSLKVFVCLEAREMRKGFAGLHETVGERLKEDVRGDARVRRSSTSMVQGYG